MCLLDGYIGYSSVLKRWDLTVGWVECNVSKRGTFVNELNQRRTKMCITINSKFTGARYEQLLLLLWWDHKFHVTRMRGMVCQRMRIVGVLVC